MDGKRRCDAPNSTFYPSFWGSGYSRPTVPVINILSPLRIHEHRSLRACSYVPRLLLLQTEPLSSLTAFCSNTTLQVRMLLVSLCKTATPPSSPHLGLPLPKFLQGSHHLHCSIYCLSSARACRADEGRTSSHLSLYPESLYQYLLIHCRYSGHICRLHGPFKSSVYVAFHRKHSIIL